MKNRLKVFRAMHDLTQEELAGKLGVTRQTVVSIENGRYDPSIGLAFKIAKLFNVRIEDVFEYEGPAVDTVLLLGHGIGMVETLAGLDRFLPFMSTRVAPRGRILLDSLDVRTTSDPRHLAYQANNRLAGRYIGETRLQFEYRGVEGPSCGWLHVDAEMLAEIADRSGWSCRVIEQLESGEYLAQLSLR